MNEVLKEKDSAYEKGFRKPEEAIQLISERTVSYTHLTLPTTSRV